MLTLASARRLRRALPKSAHFQLSTSLRVFRDRVAAPVLAARTHTEARRAFHDAFETAAATRMSMIAAISDLRTAVAESAVLEAMGDRLSKRAAEILGDRRALELEHTFRACIMVNRVLEDCRRHFAPESMPQLDQKGLVVVTIATAAEGLLMIAAMGLDGECPIRSNRVLGSVISDAHEATVAHYAAAKAWTDRLRKQKPKRRKLPPRGVSQDSELREWLESIAKA